MIKRYIKPLMLLTLALGLFVLAGCGGETASEEPAAVAESSESAVSEEEHADHDEEGEHDDHDHSAEAVMAELPDLTAIELNDRSLRIVATTNIIGDVIGNIGGDTIELITLMGPGVDPHSYEPSAADFTAVADADVIFINGWDLEEGLVEDLETAAEGTPIVVISAGIEPLELGEGAHDDDHEEEGEHDDHEEEGEHDDHDHSGADPHVWFSVHNVEQWAKNTEAILHVLDPENHESYEANLENYLQELEMLDDYVREQVASIPQGNRKLVTNHDSFGYLAAEHGFEVVGTVIPAASTAAEPSARDLADLIEQMNAEGVCTLFTENTVSTQLVDTVAAELANCGTVQVLPLYTGSLGDSNSGADTYIGFMQTNIDTITSGLSQ